MGASLLALAESTFEGASSVASKFVSIVWIFQLGKNNRGCQLDRMVPVPRMSSKLRFGYSARERGGMGGEGREGGGRVAVWAGGSFWPFVATEPLQPLLGLPCTVGKKTVSLSRHLPRNRKHPNVKLYNIYIYNFIYIFILKINFNNLNRQSIMTFRFAKSWFNLLISKFPMAQWAKSAPQRSNFSFLIRSFNPFWPATSTC